MASLDRVVLLVLFLAIAASWSLLVVGEAAYGSEASAGVARGSQLWRLAALDACVAAALLASFTPMWRRRRTPILMAVRLLACTLASWATAGRFLDGPSTSFSADALRTLLGAPLCTVRAWGPPTMGSYCALPHLPRRLMPWKTASGMQVWSQRTLQCLTARHCPRTRCRQRRPSDVALQHQPTAGAAAAPSGADGVSGCCNDARRHHTRLLPAGEHGVWASARGTPCPLVSRKRLSTPCDPLLPPLPPPSSHCSYCTASWQGRGWAPFTS